MTRFPPGGLVASGQRPGKNLRKRLVGAERCHEERADELAGLRGGTSAPGSRVRATPASAASPTLGERLVSPSRDEDRRAREDSSRRSVMRAYSALARSITSHGSAGVRREKASRSPRTVCDFPPPVAPQTNVCRFSVPRLTVSGPAGRRKRSRTTPSSTWPPGSLSDSRVVSNNWAATTRSPGSSASGGRTRAAARSAVARKGIWPPDASLSPLPARTALSAHGSGPSGLGRNL